MDRRSMRRRRRRRQQFLKKLVLTLCFVVCICGMILFLRIYSDGFGEKKGNGLSGTEGEKNVAGSPQTEKIMTETEQTGAGDLASEAKDQEVLGRDIRNVEDEFQRIQKLSPGGLAGDGILAGELVDRLFFEADIQQVFSRISGVSYVENPDIALSDLAYLRMLYYGSDGNTYVGEMIVNQKIKDTVLSVFRELYENRYPIERMVLVDEYGGEDERSMEANNTSAFNYRVISGSSRLSNHSYGMAVDLNPKYNPYVKQNEDGSIVCQPESGRDYADRSREFEYKIDENDLAYRLFTEAGFTWGGNWNSVKDYQHFEME